MKMTNICKKGLAGAMLLLSNCGAGLAAETRTEEQLVQDLSSSSKDKVASALLHLEKEHPNSPASLHAIKKCLYDQRVEVRRKAARVLGAVHANVDAENLKPIVALLNSSDPKGIVDGLKALRGIRAPINAAVIVPLLQHSNPNVIRDACRALAVLGSRANVPAIEPLLTHANKDVRDDAQIAINTLRGKR